MVEGISYTDLSPSPFCIPATTVRADEHSLAWVGPAGLWFYGLFRPHVQGGCGLMMDRRVALAPQKEALTKSYWSIW